MEHYKKRIHKQVRGEIKTNFEAFDNNSFLAQLMKEHDSLHKKLMSIHKGLIENFLKM